MQKSNNERPQYTPEQQTIQTQMPVFLFVSAALNKVYTLFLHFTLYSPQYPTVYKIDISDLTSLFTLFFRGRGNLVHKTGRAHTKIANKNIYMKERLKAWRIKSFIISPCMV